MTRLYINGKFYAGGLNGVHRVADRLIRELDRNLAETPEQDRPEAVLFIPTRRTWTPSLMTIRLIEAPRGHSQVWEQLILPFQARDGVLLNLCNLGPVLHGNKVLMIHDAQFLFPDSSYPARLRWGYRLLTPLMAQTSRLVLTVSEYSRQMLDVLGVAPSARTQVLHNGVDHMLDTEADATIVDRLGLVQGRFAVHIASVKSYKNTAIIFEAFSDPALADISLVLVGPDRDSLVKAGLTPPPSAVFAGRIDDAGLRGLYQSALCLLLPSRTEGFSLPPAEAAMVGCPSVVSPAGAVPEVCGDTVLYAAVNRSDEWVKAIRAYADDGVLRQAKIALSKARAHRFTWTSSGRILLDALRRLGVARASH